MRIIKLGGSLCRGELLDPWLEAVARTPRLVVVPGGGPFADTIRSAQGTWGVDDGTAHRMALLAMDQYALMLCPRHPRLRLTHDAADIAAALNSRRIPVWAPYQWLSPGHDDVTESWDFTADSLALWLGIRLVAEEVLLVKSVDAPAGADAGDLARAGVVDACFPMLQTRTGVPFRILGPSDLPEVGAPIPAPG